MSRSAWFRRAIVLAALTASLPLSARESPGSLGTDQAPRDVTSLVAEVRRRLPLDLDLQSNYVCVQRESEVRLDGDGRQTSKSIREYEVYPSVAGKPPFRRLIARDGVPVSAAELAESDRRRETQLADTVAEREKRSRHETEERRDRQALMDEVFRLFDFKIVGREVLSGRPAYLVAFTPRAGVTASSRTASIVQKFAGRAWVDEQDLRVVRVEGQSTEDVAYGYGVLARLYKGTTVLWERKKVDDTAWVPARLEIRAAARVMLFRRLGLYRITDYLNYRRLPSAPLRAER